MFSRLLISLSLLWIAGAAQNASGQSKDLRDTETVLERRIRLDDTRWFFQAWEHPPLLQEQRASVGNRRTVAELIRGFVTEEQFEALNDAYKKRLATHLELQQKMYPFEVLESRARMLKRQRQSEEDAREAFPIPSGSVAPSPEEAQKALQLYVREQDKAEKEWAKVVDEVLTPEQFATFIKYFVFTGKAYLHHPLLQNHLGYDDTQQREIQKQLDLYASTTNRVRREGRDSVTDVEVQRSYYRAFAILTTAQFQKLAPAVGLKNESESWTDFRARIKQEGGAAEEVLGPLVDNVLGSLKK